MIQDLPPALRRHGWQGIIQDYTRFTSTIERAGLPRYYTRLYKIYLQHWEGRVAKVLYKIIQDLPPALRGQGSQIIIQDLPPALRGQGCQDIIQDYTRLTSSIERAGLPRYYTRLLKLPPVWRGQGCQGMIQDLPPAWRGQGCQDIIQDYTRITSSIERAGLLVNCTPSSNSSTLPNSQKPLGRESLGLVLQMHSIYRVYQNRIFNIALKNHIEV